MAEYRAGLRRVRRAHTRAEDPEERRILASMLRDMEWVVTYMETGHPPVERGGPYSRAVPVDPVVMQRAWSARECIMARARERGIQAFNPERSALETVLGRLTERERDAFILLVGHGYSQRETASLMGLSRRRIRDLHDAARAKIQEAVAAPGDELDSHLTAI